MERLQKYMAYCGVASRRKCEEYILQGKVKVNNLKVDSLGTKVDPEIDIVEFEGKIINKEERKVYIMLNKPLKYVTTVKDERGRKTVLDLINVKERIYPIGRLDYMTSGLLLLTNDGDVYNNIMHPRVNVVKTYIAKVKGIPTEDEINRFQSGVDIGGYITATSSFRVLKKKDNITDVEIQIHEGKNRQIRKMCDVINHPVIELRRVSIGRISLGNLKYGSYRNLTDEEIKYLKEL